MEAWDHRLHLHGRFIAALALLIVLGAWLLRWESGPWGFEPSGDGFALVTEPRAQVLSLENLRLCWTEGYWLGQDDPLYRPLTTTTFALVAALERLLGLPAGGLQVMSNVGLHLLNAYLAFAVLAAALRRKSVALLAAVLWAVHPGHLEAVVGIAGRSDLLAMALGLASCMASLRGRLGSAFALAVLAALSKESGCFFFAAPIILSWATGRVTWAGVRRQVWACVGGVIVVVAFQVWRHLESPGYFIPFGDNPLVILSAPERMAAAAHLLVTQGGRWFLDGMAFFDGSYASPEVVSMLSPDTAPPLRWVSLLAIFTLGYAALVSIESAPAPSFCLLWFLGAILPTANLIVPIGTAWGDRLLYVPSLGVFLLGALWLFSPSLHQREPGERPKLKGRFAIGLAGAVVCAGALMFQARSMAWQNNDTLTIATFPDAPRSYRYLTGMAQIHLKVSSLPGRENDLSLAQEFAEEAANLWMDSGRALWQQDGRPAALLAHVYLARSRQADPAARSAWLDRAESQFRRAILIGDAKRLERASRNGGRADGSAQMDYIAAVKSLTTLLVDRGQLSSAEALLRQAVAAAPIVVDFRTGLGVVLAKQGREAESRVAFLESLLLQRRAHLLTGGEREEAAAHLATMSQGAEAKQYYKFRARLEAIARDFGRL